jgi:glycosyltransferase involved in cell wall biosynthesis
MPVSEIVLSDDASADDTVAIVEGVMSDWPSPGPELQIIRNSRALGVTANFEQAALACTGDFIALSDQDDLWHTDKIASILQLFEERPEVDLVHTDAALVDIHGGRMPGALLASLDAKPSELREIHAGRGYETLLRRNLVTGATVVFRRSLLDRAVPFAPDWVHDEWLAIVAAATSGIDVIQRELIDYRQHGGNQIGARSLSLREKFGRLSEPRAGRNRRLLARTHELHERLVALGASPEAVALAAGKLAHENFRSALPGVRVARLPAVIAAWGAGTYGRFSRGVIDVARDLLQPAD